MIVLGNPEKVLDTKGVNHMENEMLDQMHKKLVWKITIQFIWILCITAMIVCIIYEGIMQVHRNHVWALGGMALILLKTYFIWNLHTLWELFENKTKVENELERSSTLIHCVTEFSSNQDFDEAINHLLELINQYYRGGMISLSWHARNPMTGGDAWDIKDSTVVKSILPGGINHQKFVGWLDKVSAFISSLQTADNVKVPILFRPWHENTGSWFWWGEQLCTPDEYKALWEMTVNHFRLNGVNNILYAYSPGTEPKDTAQYLERYPGDEMVDVIGLDTYQFNRNIFLSKLDKSLAILDSIGKTHDKVYAVTEIGYEGIPDAKWWTSTLLPALTQYSLAYALVWRNARERVTHFYAPYPGQVSATDFVEFYKHPKTLFAEEVNLYQ